MNPENEQESLLELLKRARQEGGPTGPEVREENLRRLVRAAMPEVEVPASVRRRVKEVIASHQTSPPPLTARLAAWLRGGQMPGMRRILAGAAPLALAVLLVLFLSLRAPVHAGLKRTLDAMARVRSAHCVGSMVNYIEQTPDGRPISEHGRCEWLYRAPAQYRREVWPAKQVGSAVPQTLIVNDEVGSLTNGNAEASSVRRTLSPASVMRHLSPLDFFSQEGMLRRAEREKRARVRYHKMSEAGRTVEVLTVGYPSGGDRHDWVLTVDPASDRLLRSEYTWSRQQGSSWAPVFKRTLDRFEYDLSVRDSLFSD